jgi:hypothetical protein
MIAAMHATASTASAIFQPLEMPARADTAAGRVDHDTEYGTDTAEGLCF